MYQPKSTAAIIGTAAMKNHLMLGSFVNVSTFIPKKPTVKVRGRKMKVIQLRRHMDVLSCKPCLLSRISTDLYMRSCIKISTAI